MSSRPLNRNITNLTIDGAVFLGFLVGAIVTVVALLKRQSPGGRDRRSQARQVLE